LNTDLYTATAVLPGRPAKRLVRYSLEIELEKPELHDVVGITDEPIKNARDAGRVSLGKVGRVEGGRLWARSTVLVRHAIALWSCSRHAQQ